jgi:hypothetical protein
MADGELSTAEMAPPGWTQGDPWRLADEIITAVSGVAAVTFIPG